MMLHLGIALSRGAAIPLDCLGHILPHPNAFLIRDAHGRLGAGVAMLRLPL